MALDPTARKLAARMAEVSLSSSFFIAFPFLMFTTGAAAACAAPQLSPSDGRARRKRHVESEACGNTGRQARGSVELMQRHFRGWRGLKPILLRKPYAASSGLPQLIDPAAVFCLKKETGRCR